MIDTIPLEKITEAHLRSLIDNGVTESRTLEFKRDQIGANDDAKKEFLKDITALANTIGGDLVVGIEDDKGIAKALRGIPDPPDPEIRRLDSVLQSSVEPRLHGVRMQQVPLSSGGFALVIRVPQSWNPPHRVSFKGTNKFYSRSTASVNELDVDELRAAFLGSAEIERRLTDFRIERIAKIKAGQALVSTEMGQFVVHICPMRSGFAFNPASARASDAAFAPLRSIKYGGYSPRMNFDGLAVLSGASRDRKHYSTTQVFRNGCIEFACAEVVRAIDAQGTRAVLWSMANIAAERLPIVLPALAELGVPGPYFVVVSLLSVRDTYIIDHGRLWAPACNFTHDDLLLPPAIFDDLTFDKGWQKALQPMLDAWWNAYDIDRCIQYFTGNGDWIET